MFFFFCLRYSTCWPAMQHKMDGIIFVYTEPSNQQKAALNRFYDFFVEQPNFPEDCCIVMKNQLSEGNGDQILDNPLPGLSHAGINLQVKGGEFKKTFNSFVSTVMKFSSND